MSGQDLIRAAENDAVSNKGDSLYSGTGKSRDAKNSKIPFLKKRKGFAGIILAIGLLTGGAVLMGSSNTFLPGAMENMLTGISDFRYPATYTLNTNNKFMKAVLNRIKGTNNKPTSFSDDFTENLKTFGIDVNDNGSDYTLSYKGKTITGDNFSEVFDDDLDFRTAFTNARQGRAANFFDQKATTNYNYKGIDRNTLKDYKTTGDIQADTEEFNQTLGKKFNNNTVDIDTTYEEDKEREVKGEDGKTTTEKYPANESNDTASSTSSNTDFEVAKTRAGEFIGKFNKVTNVLNWGCTIMRTGNMVIKTASAMERLQSILYFMGIMESISKTMAGDGESSGINVLMNFLTTPSTTTIADYMNASASASYDKGKSDSIGTLEINIGETETTKAPIESNVSNILADQPLDQDLAKNFSFDSMAMLFTGAFGYTTMKAAGCAISNIGESVASLAINFIPGGQGIKIIGGSIYKNIILGMTSFALGSVLGFMIPQLAKTLFMNNFLTASGLEAGEQIARGSLAANGSLAQSSGNGIGTMEDAASFARVSNTVLAMEAESDRLNRSPFDINSKNTFLGSITYSLLGTALSTKTYSTFTSLTNTTAKSLASLTGGAYADSAENGTNIINTRNDCEFSSMDIAGTAWCTVFPSVSDTALNMDPSSEDFINTINQELDDDGQIKKNSDLAKTISYCFERDTNPSETPDARILSELQVNTPRLLSLAGAIIPQINDVLNIIESASDLDEENLAWATGEACITHPKMDYYKAYAIQESVYEQTMASADDSSVGYVSPITAYAEQYHEEHPVENMTDLIAHYAGLTTEDADLMLALVDYYEFMEDYEPDTRIAMDGTASDLESGEEVVAGITEEHPIFSEDDSEEPIIANQQYIIYADVRNRSHAA